MNFRKDEWALYFDGDGYDFRIQPIRIAENVYNGKEVCLVHMGSFNTSVSTKYLHKMPSSIKKLIPKDPKGKILSVI